jgi:hypothetical protein
MCFYMFRGLVYIYCFRIHFINPTLFQYFVQFTHLFTSFRGRFGTRIILPVFAAYPPPPPPHPVCVALCNHAAPSPLRPGALLKSLYLIKFEYLKSCVKETANE